MSYRWSDMKMRTKLLTLVAVGIVGLIIVGAMGMLNQKRAQAELKQLNTSIQHVSEFSEMKSRFLTARQLMSKALFSFSYQTICNSCFFSLLKRSI